MHNQILLMSGVDYLSDEQAINPFMEKDAPIDLETAAAEHSAIANALRVAGVEVHIVEPPADCQDGVFTANWALIRGDTAVMARLPNARKGEEAYAAKVLSEKFDKKIIYIPGDYKFSGQGDALPCGDYLFCGSGYRSDIKAQEFVAKTFAMTRVQLQTKPQLDGNNQPVINQYSGWADSFYYDIDLAISILKPPVEGQKGLIAWCPEAFTADSQQIMREFDAVDKIEVSEKEAINALACNLVSTGEIVIMNSGAPEFQAAIEACGLKTVLLSNPELAKNGGSVRCTSLALG